MNVLAILQARVSSTRLPGKVLAPILDRPMLARQLERLHRATTLDHLIVATSIHETDNPLADFCLAEKIPCYRGSLHDVLDRFYQAMRVHNPTHIVRLTADCPLADPGVIDLVVRHHLESNADYTSNTIEPTWPDGLDIEIMRRPALERAWGEAHLPSEREHVTPYLYRSLLFNVNNIKGEQDLSHLRWTVDEPTDLDFVRAVYEQLYVKNPAFDTKDILSLLSRMPQLGKMNAHLTRNAGYALSLAMDPKP